MEDTLCKDLICSSCGYALKDCKNRCSNLEWLDDIDIFNLQPQPALPVISLSSSSSDPSSDESHGSPNRFKKPLLSFQSQASGLLSSLTALLTVDRVYDVVCQWAEEADALFVDKQLVTFEDGLLFEAMIFGYLLSILDSSDKTRQQQLLTQVGACLRHLVEEYKDEAYQEMEFTDESELEIFDLIWNSRSVEYFLWVIENVLQITSPLPSRDMYRITEILEGVTCINLNCSLFEIFDGLKLTVIRSISYKNKPTHSVVFRLNPFVANEIVWNHTSIIGYQVTQEKLFSTFKYLSFEDYILIDAAASTDRFVQVSMDFNFSNLPEGSKKEYHLARKVYNKQKLLEKKAIKWVNIEYRVKPIYKLKNSNTFMEIDEAVKNTSIFFKVDIEVTINTLMNSLREMIFCSDLVKDVNFTAVCWSPDEKKLLSDVITDHSSANKYMLDKLITVECVLMEAEAAKLIMPVLRKGDYDFKKLTTEKEKVIARAASEKCPSYLGFHHLNEAKKSEIQKCLNEIIDVNCKTTEITDVLDRDIIIAKWDKEEQVKQLPKFYTKPFKFDIPAINDPYIFKPTAVIIEELQASNTLKAYEGMMLIDPKSENAMYDMYGYDMSSMIKKPTTAMKMIVYQRFNPKSDE